MLNYPVTFEGYPDDWLDVIASVTDKETLIRIEKKEDWSAFNHKGLSCFHHDIERLSTLPMASASKPIPYDSFTFRNMIPKKKHEIEKLAPIVHEFYLSKNISKIVDIGGGIGLLAQTLTNHYAIPVISVDMDSVLQNTGSARNQKNAKVKDLLVEYQNLKVDSSSEEFSKLLGPDSMTLGLHTCGSLAVDQLRTSTDKKIQGLINLGCCYHKMEFDLHNQNLSFFARQHQPLTLSRFALTLASRAHRKLDGKDFDLKTKVKFYRYAIHILLHDFYGKEGIVPLGNSLAKLYDETFGIYALEQLKRIGIDSHSLSSLDEFYRQPQMQKLLWRMVSSGILRNSFGRLLELYILFDRAIYLEEQGYEVQVEEFFSEELSPRNIGITAYRK